MTAASFLKDSWLDSVGPVVAVEEPVAEGLPISNDESPSTHATVNETGKLLIPKAVDCDPTTLDGMGEDARQQYRIWAATPLVPFPATRAENATSSDTIDVTGEDVVALLFAGALWGVSPTNSQVVSCVNWIHAQPVDYWVRHSALAAEAALAIRKLNFANLLVAWAPLVASLKEGGIPRIDSLRTVARWLWALRGLGGSAGHAQQLQLSLWRRVNDLLQGEATMVDAEIVMRLLRCTATLTTTVAPHDTLRLLVSAATRNNAPCRNPADVAALAIAAHKLRLSVNSVKPLLVHAPSVLAEVKNPLWAARCLEALIDLGGARGSGSSEPATGSREGDLGAPASSAALGAVEAATKMHDDRDDDEDDGKTDGVGPEQQWIAAAAQQAATCISVMSVEQFATCANAAARSQTALNILQPPIVSVLLTKTVAELSALSPVCLAQLFQIVYSSVMTASQTPSSEAAPTGIAADDRIVALSRRLAALTLSRIEGINPYHLRGLCPRLVHLERLLLERSDKTSDPEQKKKLTMPTKWRETVAARVIVMTGFTARNTLEWLHLLYTSGFSPSDAVCEGLRNLYYNDAVAKCEPAEFRVALQRWIRYFKPAFVAAKSDATQTAMQTASLQLLEPILTRAENTPMLPSMTSLLVDVLGLPGMKPPPALVAKLLEETSPNRKAQLIEAIATAKGLVRCAALVGIPKPTIQGFLERYIGKVAYLFSDRSKYAGCFSTFTSTNLMELLLLVVDVACKVPGELNGLLPDMGAPSMDQATHVIAFCLRMLSGRLPALTEESLRWAHMCVADCTVPLAFPLLIALLRAQPENARAALQATMLKRFVLDRPVAESVGPTVERNTLLFPPPVGNELAQLRSMPVMAVLFIKTARQLLMDCDPTHPTEGTVNNPLDERAQRAAIASASMNHLLEYVASIASSVTTPGIAKILLSLWGVHKSLSAEQVTQLAAITASILPALPTCQLIQIAKLAPSLAEPIFSQFNQTTLEKISPSEAIDSLSALPVKLSVRIIDHFVAHWGFEQCVRALSVLSKEALQDSAIAGALVGRLVGFAKDASESDRQLVLLHSSKLPENGDWQIRLRSKFLNLEAVVDGPSAMTFLAAVPNNLRAAVMPDFQLRLLELIAKLSILEVGELLSGLLRAGASSSVIVAAAVSRCWWPTAPTDHGEIGKTGSFLTLKMARDAEVMLRQLFDSNCPFTEAQKQAIDEAFASLPANLPLELATNAALEPVDSLLVSALEAFAVEGCNCTRILARVVSLAARFDCGTFARFVQSVSRLRAWTPEVTGVISSVLQQRALSMEANALTKVLKGVASEPQLFATFADVLCSHLADAAEELNPEDIANALSALAVASPSGQRFERVVDRLCTRFLAALPGVKRFFPIIRVLQCLTQLKIQDPLVVQHLFRRLTPQVGHINDPMMLRSILDAMVELEFVDDRLLGSVISQIDERMGEVKSNTAIAILGALATLQVPFSTTVGALFLRIPQDPSSLSPKLREALQLAFDEYAPDVPAKLMKAHAKWFRLTLAF